MVPLVLIAGAATIAGVGLKKGRDGVGSLREAKQIGEQAERRQRIHVDLTASARERLLGRLRLLQSHRSYIVEHTFGRLRSLLQRLERRGKVHGAELLPEAVSAAETVVAFTPHELDAATVAGGAAKAVLAGHAATVLTTTAVGQLAAASTGTAISCLSGAAATSARLAWLGGGAIAAGGGGVAMGTAVVGSLAVGPVVGVGGFVLAAQGAKAKTAALAYAGEVDGQIARMDALISLHHRAERRVNELGWLTEHLNARTCVALERADAIADVFDDDDDDHVARVATAFDFARALGAVVRVRILDETGELLPASREIIDRYKKLLEETLGMPPKITTLPTGLGALVAQALTNPQAMAQVLDGVREIAASIKVIKEQETAQAEIASKTQIEVARVQAVRDVMLSYLDKSFDERRANFEALFARVDQAAARGDAATVSAALDAVVSLGKSSPFKDLADVASAKAALKDKGREWEF